MCKLLEKLIPIHCVSAFVRGFRDSARLLADTKIEGPLRKKIGRKSTKSRNGCRVSGGGVDAWGMVTKGASWRGPGTKYKRSKIAFAVTSIALSLGHLGARLLGLPTPSLIGSPDTLFCAKGIRLPY